MNHTVWKFPSKRLQHFSAVFQIRQFLFGGSVRGDTAAAAEYQTLIIPLEGDPKMCSLLLVSKMFNSIKGTQGHTRHLEKMGDLPESHMKEQCPFISGNIHVLLSREVQY